jgi:hypothetical protein
MTSCYTTGSEVKLKLPSIFTGSTGWDASIQLGILEASTIIDVEFSKHGLTVSTGSMPIVPYACIDFAVAIFWENYIPQGHSLSTGMTLDIDGNVQRFWKSGYAKLNSFFSIYKPKSIYAVSISGSAFDYNPYSSGSTT